MVVRYFKSIEMQHCASCGGFWVQGNRLGEILEKYMSFIAKRRDRECGLRRRVNPYEVEAQRRACPVCAGRMKKLNYAYNSNVLVDTCGECRGVWLDRGEIEGIASFLKNCGLPERIRQEFEEIKTIYDHHDRQQALELLRDMIIWILSFML
jgi:Zn-finger nucleic acid-binding protein